MGYRTLRECVDDLAATKRLVRLDVEIDPHLEAAEIQRRIYQAGGPAIYFSRLKGCAFPAVSNLFGTIERTRYLFRDTLAQVEQLIRLKIDPARDMARPWRYFSAVPAALRMLPRYVRTGPVLANETTIAALPQITSWPDDGGPFVTLPQVYTEHPERAGWQRSNLGMYRVQLGGNRYAQDREVGMHYQIHRGIGVHHTVAKSRGEPLRVSVFVGGPPAMTVSAVMPLPETVPELSFAGALGGRRVPLVRQAAGPAIHAEADFVITGTIDPIRTLPEGPFGDHLGYYAKVHEFPVLNVEHVYHRPNPIWPFTVVGRPPQEDTSFGAFIHELTGPIIPTVIPGVHGVHAVDAAGVHPLLLAIGGERYMPYAELRRPQELLTQANAILGQGQMSLAKYLMIIARNDAPGLDLHDIAGFFRQLLERIDFRRDLHFQTQTTIDTLDYSGSGLNEGSKVVMAAVGPKRRELPTELPTDPSELNLGDGIDDPRVALPGVLAVRGRAGMAARYAARFSPDDPINRWPLVVVADDSEFATRSLNNFLWTTFTRSNPAADLHGIGESIVDKHWGCRGSLVIDAGSKPHHAPPLIEDPAVTRKVEALAARGGPLHGII